jgi:hypothetical protein
LWNQSANHPHDGCPFAAARLRSMEGPSPNESGTPLRSLTDHGLREFSRHSVAGCGTRLDGFPPAAPTWRNALSTASITCLATIQAERMTRQLADRYKTPRERLLGVFDVHGLAFSDPGSVGARSRVPAPRRPRAPASSMWVRNPEVHDRGLAHVERRHGLRNGPSRLAEPATDLGIADAQRVL